MRKFAFIFLFLALLSARASFDIAVYYWPAYHNEPRWKELGIFADGRGEWQNVYEALPKYKGHNQPRFPIWGIEDESTPAVMERKIAAATSHGVNIFIFDWYWYEGKPFLESALNDGFLKAKNRSDMKFYIMWANHTVNLTWNNKVAKKSEKVFWRGEVSLAEFKNIADRMAEKYFSQPNYYKIDGKPVFCVYELGTFINGVGGLQNAKEALDYMRSRVKGGVHIQTICWNLPKGLQGIPGDTTPSSGKIAEFLGIDSFTSYSWAHYKVPQGDYADWAKFNVQNWDALIGSSKTPYYCHVSVGWDNNPRFPQNKIAWHVVGDTPQLFEDCLKQAKAWTLKRNPKQKLITVNSWNEWTEGSYLEPDTRFGYGYLEAIKRVFCDK